jgi:hypothetical protein|tara:strand:+ start:336 stop:557 length:222 start_codon:yes stop_codon:yes gene_type:complete
VHDIDDLERRGVPGVFVASDTFTDAAALQAAGLGLDVASVFVAHPIQDRTDEEMTALADGAIDALVAAITGPG